MKDRIKTKLLVASLSVIIASIVVMLYFLDISLEWNVYKTISCIIVVVWVFFIIPAIRNSYLLNEGKPLGEWFKMGLNFGASGIMFPILLAPYYGVKYYFG